MAAISELVMRAGQKPEIPLKVGLLGLSGLLGLLGLLGLRGS